MHDNGEDTGLFVYALRSLRDGGLHIGMTKDLARRLSEHNSGYERSTRARAPFEIVFVEEVATVAHARARDAREKYLKSGVSREFLRGMTQGAYSPLGRLES